MVCVFCGATKWVHRRKNHGGQPVCMACVTHRKKYGDTPRPGKGGQTPLGPNTSCIFCKATKWVNRRKTYGGQPVCVACVTHREKYGDTPRPGKPGTTHDTTDDGDILKYYAWYRSIDTVADKVKRTRTFVYRVLVRHDVILTERMSQRLNYEARAKARFAISKSEIIKRYKAGVSLEALVAEFRITRSYLEPFLQGAGVRIRNRDEAVALNSERQSKEARRRHATRNRSIIADYRSGESASKLCKRWNISGEQLRSILVEAGVPIRDKREAAKIYHAQCRKKLSGGQ